MNSNLETTRTPTLSPEIASPPKAKCWLIGSRPDLPVAVARVARLRGLDVALCAPDCAVLPSLFAARNQLIAINFDLLKSLEPAAQAHLREAVESGATLYVRGALQPGRSYSLRPFSEQRFDFSIRPAEGYRFSAHLIVPAAIAGERIITRLDLPQAVGLEASARPILSSVDRFATERPSIFALEVGAGLVIFDLHADDAHDETELMAELADPSRRPATIGALAATDFAAGRDASIPAPVNLVIDDRPINYDYFNAGKLERFLQHVDARCPGIHTDFAWTPSHTRPHRGYLNVLRRYNTGFVWHGFLRHVDHRTITDFEAHLGAGRERVADIWREYGARFQPVMIFPFEKPAAEADALLRRSGFRAQVRSAGGLPPSYYYGLNAGVRETWREAPFTVIFRDSVETLNRDQMFALAILGMPIVALAHPRDIGLRRFRRNDEGEISYFDPILKFAAEKSLRPMSLEEIAAQVPAAPSSTIQFS